jgi:hypothetical protein
MAVQRHRCAIGSVESAWETPLPGHLPERRPVERNALKEFRTDDDALGLITRVILRSRFVFPHISRLKHGEFAVPIFQFKLHYGRQFQRFRATMALRI